MGQYHAQQWRDALVSLTAALELYQELNDRAGEAKNLCNLGVIYSLLGSYPQALDYYDQSLGLLRELGNRTTEANALNNLDFTQLDTREFVQSEHSFFAAIEMLESLRLRGLPEDQRFSLKFREIS